MKISQICSQGYPSNSSTMQHQHMIPSHPIEDVPVGDDAAAAPGTFNAGVGLHVHDSRENADVAGGFFHMTASPVPPTSFVLRPDSFLPGTKQRLVRQVSVPTSESSSSLRSGNDVIASSEDELVTQLAAALAANAQLQSQLDIQSAHAHCLEEKVVSQGQTVSALCVEVDRLIKDKEELNERLTIQMEQRRIETEQFRHHLTMCKAACNGLGMQHQPNNFAVQSPRMSLPGSPYMYPPSKMAAVAPATAASPVRRMSTAMGHSSSIGGSGGTILEGPPQQPCRRPPRRMSTGAAANCA